MRGYAEINDFEEQLVGHGIVLVKYWMHITKDEQLRRFKRRQKISYKQWKLTDEDWRNREKWELYEQAVNDMIARTSTSYRRGRWSRPTASGSQDQDDCHLLRQTRGGLGRARGGNRGAGTPARKMRSR